MTGREKRGGSRGREEEMSEDKERRMERLISLVDSHLKYLQ